MFKKNQTIESAVKVSSEVITTGTILATTASVMTAAGLTIAMEITDTDTPMELPSKLAGGIITAAFSSAVVTTVVVAKKMNFFKKSQQKKLADINRRQVEEYAIDDSFVEVVGGAEQK